MSSEALLAQVAAGFDALEGGDLARAEQLAGDVLRYEPRQAGALQLLALVSAQSGRLSRAEELLRQAIAADPAEATACLNLGLVLAQQGRREDALAAHAAALERAPDLLPAALHRALLLGQLDRDDEALAAFDSLIAVTPTPEVVYERANLLKRIGRIDDALRDYDRAIALLPSFAEAFNNKGNALRELRHYAGALVCYDDAIRLRPDYADAFLNRGSVLRDLGRIDEAVSSYEDVLALDPDSLPAIVYRGICLRELDRIDEACAAFDHALRLAPDDAEAHWNRSLCRLISGDFERGWREYEWRWRLPQSRGSLPLLAAPLWLGREPIRGKTLLLRVEQGLGDTIQFCRFAATVAARGARVLLEVQPPLKRLLSGMPGVEVVLARGEPLPDFDLQCPLMSLPLALGIRVDAIPNAPYITAAPDRANHWKDVLGGCRRYRVGLAWTGNTASPSAARRSLPFAALAGLLSIDAQFVSLQKEIPDADRDDVAARPDILHVGADFAETAAIIDNLDLVVTVDTSIAHLAAGLGKQTWILLSQHADWIWLLGRDDSPWYPSVRLFRSRQGEDWRGVVNRVRAALVEAMAGAHSSVGRAADS